MASFPYRLVAAAIVALGLLALPPAAPAEGSGKGRGDGSGAKVGRHEGGQKRRGGHCDKKHGGKKGEGRDEDTKAGGKDRGDCKRGDHHKRPHKGPRDGDHGKRPRGDNGVGNGVDPQPPGDPKENDGAGTAPGSPGARE